MKWPVEYRVHRMDVRLLFWASICNILVALSTHLTWRQIIVQLCWKLTIHIGRDNLHVGVSLPIMLSTSENIA